MFGFDWQPAQFGGLAIAIKDLGFREACAQDNATSHLSNRITLFGGSVMPYQCVAASVAGFVQQLAVSYVSKGYYFYVTGVIPEHKDPAKTDRKILDAYGIEVSKWTRARRKKASLANVHYLRYRRFYVIIANHGFHDFFAAEASRLYDIRRRPMFFLGYSIGCRPARGDGEYHVSVRINRDLFQTLKARYERAALECTAEQLFSELRALPYEPYAPVRSQLRGLLRAINRRRIVAGLDQVPEQALRLRRAPVCPFAPAEPPPQLQPAEIIK